MQGEILEKSNQKIPLSPTTCLRCCWCWWWWCWSLCVPDDPLSSLPLVVPTEWLCWWSPLGPVCPTWPVSAASISRSSLRKAPKKGTTGHSAIAKALLKARSYSALRSAAERKSRTGSVSFSVMESQNGLSLFDLQQRDKYRQQYIGANSVARRARIIRRVLLRCFSTPTLPDQPKYRYI